MNTTHTPGPWFVVWIEDGDDDSGGNGEYLPDEIVSGTPDSERHVSLLSRRNASLIAAAPTMLDALKAAEHALWAEGNVVRPPGFNGKTAIEIVTEAIAKATEKPHGQLPHGNK